MDYSSKSYEELSKEYDRLEKEVETISDECAKEGLSYGEFREKAHDKKEKMYFIDKYMRLKKFPTVDFGKEWNGKIYTIEYFKSACESGLFVDYDGFGYYGTENGKSDIHIFPSDIKENIIRDDFSHVIWFNN